MVFQTNNQRENHKNLTLYQSLVLS
jgi:hypothetical protein